MIVNGNAALSLEVSRKSGTNILDTYIDVKKVLAENEGKFHPLIKAVIVDDESTEIEKRIESSENTVITAVILVMIIVIAALGIRSGLIVGLSIPTTYLFSILILDSMGMTYNLMTVFGLILAVGLLVDVSGNVSYDSNYDGLTGTLLKAYPKKTNLISFSDLNKDTYSDI